MYGRVDLEGNADNQDREMKLESDRRFAFKPTKPTPDAGQAGVVCPSCNLRRTPWEFAGLGETFVNCRNCREKGVSREVR